MPPETMFQQHTDLSDTDLYEANEQDEPGSYVRKKHIGGSRTIES